MKKSQLYAISYVYQKRQYAENFKKLEDLSLVEEFKKSKYKSITNFLKFYKKAN